MDINEVNANILKTGIGMYKAMLLIATNTVFSFDQTTGAQGLAHSWPSIHTW